MINAMALNDEDVLVTGGEFLVLLHSSSSFLPFMSPPFVLPNLTNLHLLLKVTMGASTFGTGRVVAIFNRPKQLFNQARWTAKPVFMLLHLTLLDRDSLHVKLTKPLRCGKNAAQVD